MWLLSHLYAHLSVERKENCQLGGNIILELNLTTYLMYLWWCIKSPDPLQTLAEHLIKYRSRIGWQMEIRDWLKSLDTTFWLMHFHSVHYHEHMLLHLEPSSLAYLHQWCVLLLGAIWVCPLQWRHLREEPNCSVVGCIKAFLPGFFVVCCSLLS